MHIHAALLRRLVYVSRDKWSSSVHYLYLNQPRAYTYSWDVIAIFWNYPHDIISSMSLYLPDICILLPASYVTCLIYVPSNIYFYLRRILFTTSSHPRGSFSSFHLNCDARARMQPVIRVCMNFQKSTTFGKSPFYILPVTECSFSLSLK